MRICYEGDICLPQRVPSLRELGGRYGDEFETNPWVVRAAAIAHVIGDIR